MTAASTPAAGSRTQSPLSGRGTNLQWRYFKDVAARYSVGLGGVSVLVALMLIFIYLVIEVAPLFEGASVEAREAFALPGDAEPTRYLAAEEQAEIGLRVSASGQATFFEIATGIAREQIGLPIGGTRVTRIVEVAADKGSVAAGLSDGSVLLFRHVYRISYPDDQRHIAPAIEFPYGTDPMPFMDDAPLAFSVREEGGLLLFAGSDAQGRVHVKLHDVTEGLLGGVTVSERARLTFAPTVRPDLLVVNPLVDWLYVIDAERGKIGFHRILTDGSAPMLLGTEAVGGKVVHAEMMSGGISLLTADTTGRVTQWFPARRAEPDAAGETQWYLARVRSFEAPGRGRVTALGLEQRRRGFAVGTAEGRVGLYYATSGRRLAEVSAFGRPVSYLAFEPRAQLLMALDDTGTFRSFRVHNEHPEVSWSALWGQVWYESYDEPRVLWQSSAASSDFEPKFSLTPLTLGTLKGAFYAMIFAVPFAVLGAIFTANFMAPAMRQVVKPSVEIMQALPTVILGFLAGLWMAPFVEANLAGVFLTLILLPLSIPAAGYAWTRLPERIRFLVPDGWEAALMIPLICAVTWLCFALAKPVEILAFGGNMQAWMDHELGIGYDQRNALVVGIAMGVAVIPVIYSIAEDAIFSVPKHLSLGSLALGATPWQTLVGVVLPTASPGIFSAIMIGMGRAVGETMIVLMATGNTPVTDFSMFSGMRTLSANIAVEMPESEVGSTHFRLLFLAGLVLFLLTFLFNTLGELVRQRLREKYSGI